jgi:NAD(P)-dependent dehydrogenase (short-subunit alcohol dehydrogenase family)
MAVCRLNNRNAVVAGAAQGIGFAMAQRLQDDGAWVTLRDIDMQSSCGST